MDPVGLWFEKNAFLEKGNVRPENTVRRFQKITELGNLFAGVAAHVPGLQSVYLHTINLRIL
jgi:hypothetical protein